MGETDSTVPMQAWSFGRCVVQMHARRLLIDGLPVPLGAPAFDLLSALVRHPGVVVSNDDLLDRVWPGRIVDDNNLHAQVSALRKLLGPHAIRTVRGRGYQFTLLPDPAAPALPPVAATAVRARGQLPFDQPALIGRDPELDALCSLLLAHRLVTVTGPGGVGKTRLALAAAERQAAAVDLPDGTWLVELAGDTGSTPMAEAVARALGIVLTGREQADDELLDVLCHRRLLLLLDSCEHRLPEAAALVDRLVRQTAGVRVLATSQEALHLGTEQVLRLGTLGLPADDMPASQARASGAVALFCARIEALDQGFRLDEDNRADVIAICCKLDGLPLALELAAARVPSIGINGLRERLHQHLQLLGGSGRAAPARQQTLRATLAWSHALLDSNERKVLRRLAVFAGSFSATLAQRVLADDDHDEMAVIDGLQALVDKSMVLPVPGARQMRLRLLDSTRGFALEHLQLAGEAESMALRLAQALLRCFEVNDTPGPKQIDRDQVDGCLLELDNLRAALDGLSLRPAQERLHIALAGACAWVWSRAGLRPEGLRRCRQALARLDVSTPVLLEARLQLGWASLAHHRADIDDCRAADRATALYGALGMRYPLFRSLALLATMRALRGEHQAGMATLQAMDEAFDLAWGFSAWSTRSWAMALVLGQAGRVDEALVIAHDGARRVEALDDDPGRAFVYLGLAQAEAVRGHIALAAGHARHGLAAARRCGARGRQGMLLGDLSCYLCQLGQLDEALALAREAVALRALDGTLWLQLDQLALLAARRGALREAALALGRAAWHNRWRQGRREAHVQGPLRQAQDLLEAALPQPDLQGLYALGQTLGDDEVARLTLGPGAPGAGGPAGVNRA